MKERSMFFKQMEESAASLSMAELLRREERGAVRRQAPLVTDFVNGVLRDIKQSLEDSEGTFDMANVRPERSGLPFIVYISEKGGARHDARVKVSHGPKVRDFVATVSVRPNVEVLAGDLSNANLSLLRSWIDLNRDVIVRYWDGDILYTEEALAALKPISA